MRKSNPKNKYVPDGHFRPKARWKKLRKNFPTPNLPRKDNGTEINCGSGLSGGNPIRVPSLKRSKKTWRRFKKLFWEGYAEWKYPYLKDKPK